MNRRPAALVILVVISFGALKEPYIGGIGLMALAYGDGFAALIGKKFGWKPFYVFKNKKTVSGCAGMFSATFISTAVFLLISGAPVDGIIYISLLLAAVATVFETLTPSEADNITIPLSTVAVYCAVV